MRAVSFESGLKGSTYEEKLKELDILTLEDSRKRAEFLRLSMNLTMSTRILGLK